MRWGRKGSAAAELRIPVEETGLYLISLDSTHNQAKNARLCFCLISWFEVNEVPALLQEYIIAQL